MRNILVIVFIILFATACGNSIDKDATEAAKLSRQSIEYSKNKDITSAEKAFQQKQEIFEKYKHSADFEEFETLYNQYLLDTKKEN